MFLFFVQLYFLFSYYLLTSRTAKYVHLVYIIFTKVPRWKSFGIVFQKNSSQTERCECYIQRFGFYSPPPTNCLLTGNMVIIKSLFVQVSVDETIDLFSVLDPFKLFTRETRPTQLRQQLLYREYVNVQKTRFNYTEGKPYRTYGFFRHACSPMLSFLGSKYVECVEEENLTVKFWSEII